MDFSKIESTYTSKDGCRLVWQGSDEDDTDTVILNKKELGSLVRIFQSGKYKTVLLEDEYSTIVVKSDKCKFILHNHPLLEVATRVLRSAVLEYASTSHKPQHVDNVTSKFQPSSWIKPSEERPRQKTLDASQSLLSVILSSSPAKIKKTLSVSDVFRIFATRRSTRRFSKRKVEDWKLDKILAAADSAPTAGNYQGLKIYLIKNSKIKEALTEAANNQPYVNAPAVLVFCMDPKRIKLKIKPSLITKFSMQDATITAAYAQIAAAGVGLSSIWIGMIDEKKVKAILRTRLRPTSILCIGYPDQKRLPKPKRKLRELIEVVE